MPRFPMRPWGIISRAVKKHDRRAFPLLFRSTPPIFATAIAPYNCHKSGILHKHINSPAASGTAQFVTIFEFASGITSVDGERRIRGAHTPRERTAVFIVIIFSCLFLARISNRKSAPSRRLLKLSLSLRRAFSLSFCLPFSTDAPLQSWAHVAR